MSGQIVEDLIDEEPPPSPRPKNAMPWALLVGVGIGFSLAAIIGVLDGGEDPPTALPAETDLLPTGELLPEFESGFSAVVVVDGQAMDYVEWPRASMERPISRRRLPIGDVGAGASPSLDVTGTFVAVSVPLHDTQGAALYAGPVGSVRAVASGVSGFAWHDSQEAGLGWVTRDATGEIGLWTSDGGTGAPHNLTAAVGMQDAVMVAFGDWGWALQNGDEVVVLNDFGEIVRIHTGEFMDSAPDGWLLVRREGQPITISPGGVEESFQLGAEVDDVLRVRDEVGDWWSAAFAGSPERVAILGSRGLAVIEESGNRYYTQSPSRPGLFANASHVAYMRASGGAVIVDLETGREFEVLVNDFVRTIVIG